MFKVVFLISGNGTNMNAVLEQNEREYINIDVPLVISDNPNAKGIEVAKSYGVSTAVLPKKQYGAGLSDAILEALQAVKPDLIVCAGFTSILQGKIISEYENKIINMHPSLIPAFCGKGMYGMKVHQAVYEAGVKVTGCTVHIVDSGVDTGAIIAQRTADITINDTPETIAQKVLEVEHKMLVKTIRLIADGKLVVKGNKAFKVAQTIEG